MTAVENWSSEEPDNGAAILDELCGVLTRYVAFSDHHTAAAVTLWIACTHALPAFECAPRLVLTSPEKRCGKSRALEIIKGTCHHPLASVGASAASIYRSLGGDHPPTVILDEADTVFGSRRVAEQNEDLRCVLNAGHQRGQNILRCDGPQNTPTQFPAFAMAALAGIGSMPDTITDRAVNVTMRRRRPDEQVASFRSRRDGPVLVDVHDRVAAWCTGHLDELTDAEPVMPVEDRAADTWEPLIAVADAAGGHWPETARAACLALVNAANAADEDRSSRIKLLADIRDIFAAKDTTFIATADLIFLLECNEESPWGDNDLTPRKLADRLKDFGIRPTRDATGTQRGYRLGDFTDVFSRYLSQKPSEASETSPEHGEPTDTSESSDGSNRQELRMCQAETAAHADNLTALTDSDAPARTHCLYCGEQLPAHMTAQRERGYCGHSDCLVKARGGQ